MDSKVELYIKRARTEMNMAIVLLESSNNKILHEFDIPEDETFYSGVISHCYYSIFYCAKAMLLTKRIDTKAPEVHKKTLNAFKEQFINTGIGGNKITDLKGRWEEDALAHKPDWLSIKIGINDLHSHLRGDPNGVGPELYAEIYAELMEKTSKPPAQGN